MRKTIFACSIFAAALFVALVSGDDIINQVRSLSGGNETKTMQIMSSAFEQGGTISKQFTCDGKDVNPPFTISGTPKGAKTLTLIVDDPDAPSGLWVHWTVWNIKPNTKIIAAGTVPDGGVQGGTSAGKPGYRGPCPPDGEHRYFFKVYALDSELDLPSDADKEELEEAMVGHILDKAELIGLYAR